jgi:hypothetical protein
MGLNTVVVLGESLARHLASPATLASLGVIFLLGGIVEEPLLCSLLLASVACYHHPAGPLPPFMVHVASLSTSEF